jgi:hypothetical protein
VQRARLFENITAVSWRPVHLCYALHVACFPRIILSFYFHHTPHTSPSPRADHPPSNPPSSIHPSIHIHTSPPRGKRARACARARAHDLRITYLCLTLTSTLPNPTSPYLPWSFLAFLDLPLCICIYTHIPASDGLFAHFSRYLASQANTHACESYHPLQVALSFFAATYTTSTHFITDTKTLLALSPRLGGTSFAFRLYYNPLTRLLASSRGVIASQQTSLHHQSLTKTKTRTQLQHHYGDHTLSPAVSISACPASIAASKNSLIAR